MLQQTLRNLILILSAATISARSLHEFAPIISLQQGHSHLKEGVSIPQGLPDSLESIPTLTVSTASTIRANIPSSQRVKKLHARRSIVVPTPTVNADVEICLDLSLTVLGIHILDLKAVAGLAATISSRGISAQQLAIIQSSVLSQLQASARLASSAFACSSACDSSICQSSSFDKKKKVCTLTPKQLTPTSGVLAHLIGNLALQGSGSSDYCSLCPSKCEATPSARARRVKRSQVALGLCPIGLSACPISPFSSSKGYECIDTQEEIESCGGCSSTGEGINCNTVPGVKFAGCAASQCLAFSCEEGYNLTSDQKCVAATT
ncbi:hypothetical protein DFH28DRAFT_532189 [Melampsora americana]|nr:hypothetical protein DFH28DRAFT_532189 [Melampsora americana]